MIAGICFTAYQWLKPARVIALQPFGTIDKALLETVQESLIAHHRVEVELLPSIPLPKSAYYAPRQRYRADSLIAFLKRQTLTEFHKTIGFTSADISTTKGAHVDWGIFGLGYCPGKSCVVSTFRLKNNGPEKLKERLAKVSVHELGHTYGLPHCNMSPTCVMADASGTVAQVDLEETALCFSCKIKKFVVNLP